MAKCLLLREVLLLLMLATGAAAAQVVPIVYQDEHVLVRAGIAEAGRRSIHIGDVLSLELRVQFDNHYVRLEKFDSEYFQRSFSSQPGFRLFSPPVVTHEDLEKDRVEIRAVWSFQILGCPAGQEICGDSKTYELPVISTSYQLIDNAGQVLNDKSFRFRPWPAKFAISSALPAAADLRDGFSDYFPAGAYPEMFPSGESSYSSSLAVLVGGILLAAAFGTRLSASGSLHGLQTKKSAGRRWEYLLMQLRDSLLQDEQWTDELRRCVCWYCLDELRVNPYVWLTDELAATAVLPNAEACARTFFIDMTSQGNIESGGREQCLARFTQMVEELVDIQGPGDKS